MCEYIIILLLISLCCRVTELPPVEIKDNDVCVRMLAAPINPSDINRIEGLIILVLSPSSPQLKILNNFVCVVI